MPHDSHWQHWHEQYAEPDNPLNRRLSVIRGHLDRWFEASRPVGRPALVVSACAGDGRDIIGALADRVARGSARDDRDDVRVVLVELDESLARAASRHADDENLPNVEVRAADAGQARSYLGAVPADLLMLCGVFGNVSDDDVRRTVSTVPQLAATGATVVWTRSRRAPDLTSQIRDWFKEEVGEEIAFNAPSGELFSVGVNRFTGAPVPLQPETSIFRFTNAAGPQ